MAELEANETKAMLDYIRKRGWKPDELGTWRQDHEYGYMTMTLERAYKYEMEQETGQ